MAVTLSPVGGVAGQFFDNNGDPLVGGKLYTYAAGTTTPRVTYTSATGVTPNSNPIILNGGGRVPAEIWLTDGLEYKFVLYSSTDQLIGSWDNIVGINSNFVNFTTLEEIQTATAGQTVFTLTTMQYQPGTNNLVVYVDGVNQIEGGAYSFVETNSTTVTFTNGLHVGALVKFVTAEALSTIVVDAANVAYDPAGTGAVTTNVQAKLRETVSVKDFGAVGDGVTDDTAAIQAAHDTGKAVNYIDGETYYITSSVTFGASGLVALGNGATIRIDEDLTTAYQANANVGRFELRGMNFIADGEILDTEIYKNAVSFYENTGTVIGFPTGTPYIADSVLIEDCSFSCARVFLYTVNDICTVNRNNFLTSLSRIRPCHLLVRATEQCNISENVFYAAYFDGTNNSDVLKIAGLAKNVNVTNNKFTHRYTDGNAQVDVFTGLYAAQFIGNHFYNVQYHRKQTGSAISENISYDKVIGNHFEFTITSSIETYCIYCRGARSIISSNTFKVRKSAGLTATIYAIYLDNESEDYPPYNITSPRSILINANILDFLNSGGVSNGIKVNSGSTDVPRYISVIGNHQIGGQRFLSGSAVEVLNANTWSNADTPSGVYSGFVATGNVMPVGSFIRGNVNNRAQQVWLDVTADNPSVERDAFLRISSSITLTNLADGISGQIVYIDIRVGSTIVHDTSKIVLSGSTNFSAGFRSSLTLIYTQDGYWLEIGRSSS